MAMGELPEYKFPDHTFHKDPEKTREEFRSCMKQVLIANDFTPDNAGMHEFCQWLAHEKVSYRWDWWSRMVNACKKHGMSKEKVDMAFQYYDEFDFNNYAPAHGYFKKLRKQQHIGQYNPYLVDLNI